MTINTDFTRFLDNLKINDDEKISKRYGSITRRLNMHFRDTESRTDNSLQAGSYGRHSGIRGISDLDMLYIMPVGAWEKYKKDPAVLLDTCKKEIEKTYPDTELKRDRNVVVVSFTNFVIDVVPVFLCEDGTFKYPDTYNGGSWSICDTKAELKSFKDKNRQRNGNLRRLAKMVRAWKTKNEIDMSGFLIDTLCYRFFDSNSQYDNSSFGSYDTLVRDFFQFLFSQKEQAYYIAMGSGSHVKVTKSFKKEAEAALGHCQEAILAREKEQEEKCNQQYKSLFGTRFPNRLAEVVKTGEMFIESLHGVCLTNDIEIECDVRDDRMTKLLSRLCAGNLRIQHHKKLRFYIKNSDISGNYELKWKVLNQGHVADVKGTHRGQILDDDGSRSRNETATFFGDHVVECYALQEGVVIARDRITVPIA